MIEIYMGEMATGKDHDTLCALGIGSCVVVTLYDPVRKIGALAHTMLPSGALERVTKDEESLYAEVRSNLAMGKAVRAGISAKAEDNRYVDVAINNMLKEMEDLGAGRQDMVAKLIGGANMFTSFESNIGKETVLSAKEKLKKEGINLIGEVVGGSQGRSVEFSVASGIVTVKVKF